MAVTESDVQVTAGAGTRIRTLTMSTTVNAAEQQQVITLGDGSDPTLLASVTPLGELQAAPRPAKNATLTHPAAAGNASAVLLAANDNRCLVTIYNNTSALLYVRKGAAACSTTDFTVALTTGDAVEWTFKGEIRYFSPTGATSTINVTEETP